MKTSYKIFIVIIGVLVTVGFVLGVSGLIKGLQKSEDGVPAELVVIFQKELVDRALSRGPHPIEGFDAFILLSVFTGLREEDFDGVETGVIGKEGVYSYANNELKWQRTTSRTITSAEKTVSKEGYGVLLKNLSKRLDMTALNTEEVIAIVDEIDIPADIAEHIISKRDLIRVYAPLPLSAATSPLTVYGEARGPWYFEADFQLTLVDWDGRIIAESHASAVLDPNNPESTWMTESFVPFKGTIKFELSEENRVYNRGALILQKANPSGLPENADALEIPILFE